MYGFLTGLFLYSVKTAASAPWFSQCPGLGAMCFSTLPILRPSCTVAISKYLLLAVEMMMFVLKRAIQDGCPAYLPLLLEMLYIPSPGSGHFSPGRACLCCCNLIMSSSPSKVMFVEMLRSDLQTSPTALKHASGLTKHAETHLPLYCKQMNWGLLSSHFPTM